MGLEQWRIYHCCQLEQGTHLPIFTTHSFFFVLVGNRCQYSRTVLRRFFMHVDVRSIRCFSCSTHDNANYSGGHGHCACFDNLCACTRIATHQQESAYCAVLIQKIKHHSLTPNHSNLPSSLLGCIALINDYYLWLLNDCQCAALAR